MIEVSLKQLQCVLNAKLIGEDKLINSVSTDTRAIEQDALFIALKGEHFDAHHFVDIAKEKGASALLVSQTVNCSLPQLLVEDTKLALGQLGAWVKLQCDVKTIALTGSCGKTTVKEMLGAILSAKGNTLYTEGNFNNDIGVPLTLLRLKSSDDFAVIELGANHIGEIAYCAQLVKPDIAMVTNLTSAHLEGFGSLEGVAKAKGEIFESLEQDGVAIVNLDSCALWSSQLKNKRLQTMSLTDISADFSAQNVLQNDQGCCQFNLKTPNGIYPIKLNLPGKHHVTNAILACMAALNIEGVTMDDVASGLASVAPVNGRGAICYPRKGFRLIDDSYNASLAAMEAAVDLLDSFNGEKVIVLADMAEMGKHSQSVHQHLAQYVNNTSIQTVITYGRASAVISEYCQGRHFDDKEKLIAYVVELMRIKPEVSVLIKGSNGMKMCELVSAIKRAFAC